MHLPSPAHAAWYDTNWAYRKQLTIDVNQVDANLSNFPVVINVSTDADLSAGAQPDGDEFLFTASDETTKIPHETELFVSGTGRLIAWVSAQDVLDPAFQNQPGTLQVDNSVSECAAATCMAREGQAIFAAVAGAPVLSDKADGNVASCTGVSSNVDVGDVNAANATLNINADAVWAIAFSVKMP